MYVLFCIVFVYYLCVLHVQYIFDTNFQNCAAKQKAGYLTELQNPDADDKNYFIRSAVIF